jgi:hypothetical protein
MRRNRLELQPAIEPEAATDMQLVTETRPAKPRWIPTPVVPAVGLDPAVWSERVRQVAIWRLIETWHAGQRLH